MIVVPTESWHFQAIQPQVAQAGELPAIERMRLISKVAATCLHGSLPVAIGGVLELAPHRGALWGILSVHAGAYMVELHKKTLRFLAQLPYRRLEAVVALDFEAGHRWAQMLGFEREDRHGLKYFGDDMRDYALYARIQ